MLPLFVCIALFVWGFKGFVDLRTPPKDAMELHATGQKWKWTFDYTRREGGMTEDVLHVPVDRPVRMIISSVDVLHALYIPTFRTKMDAVPGRYTDLWFQATKPATTRCSAPSTAAPRTPTCCRTWWCTRPASTRRGWAACTKDDFSWSARAERGKKLLHQAGLRHLPHHRRHAEDRPDLEGPVRQVEESFADGLRT